MIDYPPLAVAPHIQGTRAQIAAGTDFSIASSFNVHQGAPTVVRAPLLLMCCRHLSQSPTERFASSLQQASIRLRSLIYAGWWHVSGSGLGQTYCHGQQGDEGWASEGLLAVLRGLA